MSPHGDIIKVARHHEKAVILKLNLHGKSSDVQSPRNRRNAELAFHS
jgi:hypothetical protein